MAHRLPSDTKRRRFIKAHATTIQHYGKAPDDLTIPELLTKGMLILDKPAGPTSHQVVAWLKEILELGTAGHGGTLDPSVTGVLPTAIGDATRALQTLLISGKEFDAHSELPEREPYFHKFTMSAIAGIGYTFWNVLTFSARFNYSIIPIRDHPSGQSYLLNQGQYSHVLSFAVYYKISGTK